MTEKMRAYLEGIFATAPNTPEVNEAKEELYTSMVEHYNDCLLDGMDEQEAYDKVIESIGDIRELLGELGAPAAGQATQEPGGFNIGDIVRSITDFTGGLVSGLFSTVDANAAQQLVNTRTVPLDGITSVDISYISESITLLKSEDNQLVIKEYMNREDPELYAQITLQNTSVRVRNGRRSRVLGLRSRIEIYLPTDWNGSLTLATISGNIASDEAWKLASLNARTVSGGVTMNSVEGGLVHLTSTSGSVKLEKGEGTVELHSISGSVKAGCVKGNGSFKTTSGSVRVDFAELTGHVDASTVSGSVRLNLPEDASFEFDGRSVSGGIYTAFDGKLAFQSRNKAHGLVGEAPYHQVKVSSTSGSIHVND